MKRVAQNQGQAVEPNRSSCSEPTEGLNENEMLSS